MQATNHKQKQSTTANTKNTQLLIYKMMIFSRYPRSLHRIMGVLTFIVTVTAMLLLLSASSADAFSSKPHRSALSTTPPTTRQNGFEHRTFHYDSSTTLQQASIAMPEYQHDSNNNNNNEDGASLTIVQKLRLALTMPRGGGHGAARRTPAATTPATTTTMTVTPKQDSFLKRHPFRSAVAITTANAILADLLTQLVFQASSASIYNWKRTAMFGVFGFFYQGMVQYAIVNGVWEKVFPGTSRRAVMSKICAMNLLSDPLFFMPTFYIFQEVLTSGVGSCLTTPMGTIQAALMAYKGNCFMDWRNSWLVWFPGHAVTYGVMPSHKRIPWMAFLSFFYMCILSITRG